MDENHRDKTESKLTATPTDVSQPSKAKVGMPKHNGVHKRKNPGAKFFKTWATPIGAIVAAIVAVSGFIFGVYQFNANAGQQQQLTREQEAASAQMQVTQEAASAAQALDQQRQTTLDTYLDRMSDLLLTYHLAASEPGDQVQALAQARTYTALRNLDGPRKVTLVRFLLEAKLINGTRPIISLSGADLSRTVFAGDNLTSANLTGANLYTAVFTDANLSGANLSGANLSDTNLSGANLSGGYFTGANLEGADLLNTNLLDVHMNSADLSGAYLYWSESDPTGSCGACARHPTGSLDKAVSGACASAHCYPNGLSNQDLSDAPLEGADLSLTDLTSADLSHADLRGANLSEAYFSGANLSNADLAGADLSYAHLEVATLSKADFTGADLEGAFGLTQQQLDEVSSCNDAILPPGLTCHLTSTLRTPTLQSPSLIDLLKYFAALAFAVCIGYYFWTHGILPRSRSKAQKKGKTGKVQQETEIKESEDTDDDTRTVSNAPAHQILPPGKLKLGIVYGLVIWALAICVILLSSNSSVSAPLALFTLCVLCIGAGVLPSRASGSLLSAVIAGGILGIFSSLTIISSWIIISSINRPISMNHVEVTLQQEWASYILPRLKNYLLLSFGFFGILPFLVSVLFGLLGRYLYKRTQVAHPYIK